MPTTMAEMARQLGISQATVSRVLNGKGHGFISIETRKRVVNYALDVGYPVPSEVVAGLSSRSGVVALWTRNPDAPYYARIVRRMQQIAAEFGADLIVSPVADRAGDGAMTGLLPRVPGSNPTPIAGVVAVDCQRLVRLHAERPGAAPIVNAGSEPTSLVDSVTFDLHAGARAAAEHLLARGSSRLAHLTAEGSIESIRRARHDGFCDVLRQAGREPRVFIAPTEDRAGGRMAVREALSRGEKFDAIFCLNDDLAIGAYRGLLDSGIEVPRDVAIVGYDSIEDTEFLEVPISSVLQPAEELCRRAWEMLWQRIEDPSAPLVSEVLVPRLIVRASSEFS